MTAVRPDASASAEAARTATLVRRIRFLVAFTIAYNVIEAVVALGAGAVAGSSALLAFGLDSVIEVSSAAGVAWQFAARDHVQRQDREQTALRITAFSFFGLAAFIAWHASASLLRGDAADPSRIGIVLAALSLLVMPAAALSQRRFGRELGSRSAVADSQQTMLCAYMSAALFVGLLANATLGWWWADPVAGLLIAGLAVREGVEAWRGEGCCAPTGTFELLLSDGAGGGVRPSGEDVPAGCGCACGSKPQKVLGRGGVQQPGCCSG